MKKTHHLYKKLIYVFVIASLVLVLGSCAENKITSVSDSYEYKSENDVSIYLSDGEQISTANVVLKKGEEIQEIKEYLEKGIVDKKLYKTVPSPDILVKLSKHRNGLTIYLSDEYKKMNNTEKLIMKTSVVKSFTSLDFIDFVEFYLDGIPLKTADGKSYGVYYSDDVVFSDDQLNKLEYEHTVNIYYPAEEGKIKKKMVRLSVSRTNSLEKEIVNQIIKDSINVDGDVFSSDIVSIDSHVDDGICYINMKDIFFITDEIIAESYVAVYLIVNSLTELPKVNKVQFLVDGEKIEGRIGNLDLSEPLEYNYDIVE